MTDTTAPTKKITYPEELVARTAATLAPGPMKLALEHKGSEEYNQALVFATMIELSQQAPGPMSDKARAHQEKMAADAKAANDKLEAEKAAQANKRP